MPPEINSHPSTAELQNFAHGRLGAKELAEVERHVAQCDSCCKVLESVPEDTLVQMAREAATEAFRIPVDAAPRHAPLPVSGSQRDVPPELADHSRYKVLGLLGLGGMGAVYKAEHRLMERLVALKVISQAFTANPQAVERFRREVKAAARLSHANIVTAHDAEQAGELHFLVMEFVDGVSLDRLVAKQGTPTIPQACGLIRQAALGLQHAHEKGMVHRDIKPANLMVTRKGQVKILDFGLARLAREMRPDAPEDGTAAGMILGTPDYISPEQAADSRSADIRADIYSLGCTFYFLLTGKPPFPAGTMMQKLAAHMHEPPPALALQRADIPAEVAAIVERMMAKKPDDRYQTPSEVAKDLAAVQKGSPSNQPKLEELKPADDFFAGVDLGAIPASPAALRPSASFQPPSSGNVTNDFTDWFSDNRKLVAILAAVGGCLLVLVLGVWGAGKFLSDDPQPPANSKNAVAGVKPAAAAEGPASKQPIPAGVPGKANHRVLFCVPHDGIWEPDYYNVADSLPKNIAITVASTQPGKCYKPGGAASSVTAQLVIGRDPILAQDYDAIIFCGATTTEFHQNATKDLIDDFANSGKFVTAICLGQQVLLFHKHFTRGRHFARSERISYGNIDSILDGKPVVRDGQWITGSDENAGGEFAATLAAAIEKKNP